MPQLPSHLSLNALRSRQPGDPLSGRDVSASSSELSGEHPAYHDRLRHAWPAGGGAEADPKVAGAGPETRSDEADRAASLAGQDADPDDWGVSAEDRVGAPIKSMRWRRVLRRSAVFAAICGLGWSYATDGPLWSGANWAARELVALAAATAVTPVSQPASVAPETAPPAAQAAGHAVSGSAPAVVTPDSVKAPLETAAGDGAASSTAQPALPLGAQSSTSDELKQDRMPLTGETPNPAAVSQPYAPPPSSAPAALTPIQTRAVAAGLHPDLSKDLLERLTTDDYRNARAAVGEALARKPDVAGEASPRKPGRGAATFTVHFVAGAGEGCRRFVVTIAKAGWETTAPPMESCGGRFVPIRS